MIARRNTVVSVFLMLVVCSAAVSAADSIDAWQERFFKLLKTEHIISGQTQLASANYVCTLRIGKSNFNVFNVVEYIHAAKSPRGNNRIIMMSPKFKTLKAIQYDDQYPLFCVGNKLYVHGDISKDNTEPYGNTLTFDRKLDFFVSSTDAKDYPIPDTRWRSTFFMK